MTHRLLLAVSLLIASAMPAAPVDHARILPIDPANGPVRFERVPGDAPAARGDGVKPQIIGSPRYDICIKDTTSGAIVRFQVATGQYVACGPGGFYEEGRGTVTTQGDVVTLSHTYKVGAIEAYESVHATANVATGQGNATINASDETGGFVRFAIDDPHIGSSDCSECLSRSAINEGVVNSYSVPTGTLDFVGSSLTGVTVLQQVSWNPDFAGTIKRLVAGVARQGTGSLSFQLVAYSDHDGSPDVPIYAGPIRRFSVYPGLPVIGLVEEAVRIDAGPKFWTGVRWNPSLDPVVLPFGVNADGPLAKIDVCEEGESSCTPASHFSGASAIRSLYLSEDFRVGQIESGGYTAYDVGSSDILSDKCDGAYYRYDVGPFGFTELYAESPRSVEPGLSDYGEGFVRVTPFEFSGVKGLDGVAETRYSGKRYSALSFTSGNQLRYCTRPSDATDYRCHVVAGFQSGTCQYTRIVGVKAGFELSCANAPLDRIDRWMITRGPTDWQTQPLNPVTASPSIGSPEFGFNWYMAASFKLGVTYEYKTTSGEIQATLANGNTFTGPFHVDDDLAPAGFNPALASRMAGDCTRPGLCVFGRYDLSTQNNVVDMIDFRETSPEIKSWLLGPGPGGIDFGRAVDLSGREGNALYASYGLSSNASNQYTLRLDYLDFSKYTKLTFARDFAAGSGSYPLALSREHGDWGLGHSRGVDLYRSLTEGCNPARIRGHESGAAAGATPGFPCQNVALVQKF